MQNRLCSIAVSGIAVVGIVVATLATTGLEAGAREYPGSIGPHVSMRDYLKVAASETIRDEPILLKGKVSDLLPHPRGRVEIYAELWPSQKALDAMEPGDSFKRLPLARTTTRAGGGFTLHADPSSIPAAYRSADGTLDVSVTAWDASSAAHSSQSNRVDGKTGLFVEPLAASPTAEQLKSVRSAAAVPAPLAVPTAIPGSGVLIENVSTPQRAYPKATVCKTVMTQREIFANAKIADGLPARGQKSSAVFTSRQSITMGTAVSATGKAGSWSASGEVTRTASFSQEFAASSARRHYLIEVELARFKDTCATVAPGYGGRGAITYRHHVRPMGFTGGSSTAKASMPNWSKCRPVADGKWSRHLSTGSAYEASKGLSLPAPMSISLRTKSQYNKSHKVSYMQGDGYEICGNNDLPAYASRLHGKRS